MLEPSYQKRWCILIFIMSGVFLSTMDSGMLNVALPSIMRFYQLKIEDTELVVTVYLLTITSTLVFWGKLSDRVDRGRIYISGLGIFTIGALCCYFSGTYFILLVCRFIQGIGAAMMMSAGPAIIKQSFPADNLGRSLGLIGIATACGLLAGPLVSGQIMLYQSWQVIFLITSSVGMGAFCIGIFFLKPYLPSSVERQYQKFDWSGGLCWVGVAIVFIIFLNGINQVPTGISVFWAILLLGFIALFLFFEGRTVNPIVPLELFRQSYYWTAILTATISFAVLFSVLVLIPFFLDYVLHTPVDKVGFVMMSVPITLMVLSPTSGHLYDRIGAKIPTSVGLLISFAALLGLAALHETSSLLYVSANLALLGAGQALFLSPNSASVLSKVDDRHLGISSGILATSRNFGMVIGATLAATMFSIIYSYYTNGAAVMTNNLQDTESFMKALNLSFIILSMFTLVASIISTRRS